MLLTYLTISFGFLGAALLLLGLRGRRVNDHPICRRCAYDLSGARDQQQRCPECGGDLSGRRTVRPGLRIRRRRPIITGGLCTVLAMLCAAVAIWGSESQFAKLKPLWWLHLEARGADPTGIVARDELWRRLDDDELSDDEANDLIELALSIQADPSAYWSPIWGDMIEGEWDNDALTDKQLVRYLENAVQSLMTLQVRPRVRQGAVIPFILENALGSAATLRRRSITLQGALFTPPPQSSPRVARNSLFEFVAESPTIETGTLDVEISPYLTWQGYLPDDPLPLFSSNVFSSVNGAWQGTVTQVSMRKGRHSITLDMPCALMLLGASEPVVEAVVQFSAGFEVVDRDEITVELVTDERLAQEVEQSIEVEDLVAYESTRGPAAMCVFRVPVTVGDAPLVARAFLRIGDEEFDLGVVRSREPPLGWGGSLSQRRRLTLLFVRISGTPKSQSADIILRPAPEEADDVFDWRIWGNEVVLRGIPIDSYVGDDSDDGSRLSNVPRSEPRLVIAVSLQPGEPLWFDLRVGELRTGPIAREVVRVRRAVFDDDEGTAVEGGDLPGDWYQSSSQLTGYIPTNLAPGEHSVSIYFEIITTPSATLYGRTDWPEIEFDPMPFPLDTTRGVVQGTFRVTESAD